MSARFEAVIDNTWESGTRYCDMKPNGSFAATLQSGSGYSKGRDSITVIDLGG